MKMLCFDMDLTLVRSNKLHLTAFKKAFVKNGLRKVTTKELLPIFSQESYTIIKILFPHLSNKEIKKIGLDHRNYAIRLAKDYVTTIQGAKGLLKKLKPHYKIAILSNCSHNEINSILKAANIDKKIFDLIIGADEVKHSKPYPDEIFKAERLLKINDGYMIGDSIYDIMAGKKAKVKTIGIVSGNHTRKELLKHKPTKVFNKITELPKYLLKK